MKPVNPDNVGKLLEKIEVLRASLRLRHSLGDNDIKRLQVQISQIRNDLLLMTRTTRYKKTSSESKKEQQPTERRKALLERNFTFEGVFGDNPQLLHVLETLEKAASTYLPVVIEGDSGTGKELLAKVVHANSDRSDQPYVSVNCGAIPSTLLESELFGHVKGAFTGAVSNRNGKFEEANGGTLFLDEIGELTLENQVKLLRALQTGDIQRVGSDKTIRVDTRIVCATNRNLYQMSLDGQFREDLYYRLSTISVRVPPLRERLDELPLLIDYFREEASRNLGLPVVQLSPKLKDFLLKHHYRGNIRELQNIIYRLTSLSSGVAGLGDLPETVLPGVAGQNAKSINRKYTLDEVKTLARDHAEEEFLRTHLSEYKGSVTRLSKDLGLNRSYVQTLMKKHGLKSSDFKSAAT